jgi:hypothetical protein
MRNASRLGLKVPPICISNDVDDIISFVTTHGEAVLKTLRWPSFNAKDKSYPLYTMAVGKQQIQDDRKGYESGIPKFLQRRIVKKFDVRIVVVGDEIFPIAMESNSPTVDIRDVEQSEIRLRPIAMPADVEARFRRLLEIDSLEYSSADFIVDRDDRWWFIENNPNGQFYWLEQSCKVEMMAAIQSYLRPTSPPPPKGAAAG